MIQRISRDHSIYTWLKKWVKFVHCLDIDYQHSILIPLYQIIGSFISIMCSELVQILFMWYNLLENCSPILFIFIYGICIHLHIYIPIYIYIISALVPVYLLPHYYNSQYMLLFLIKYWVWLCVIIILGHSSKYTEYQISKYIYYHTSWYNQHL
jgi:hypothetical protein